MRRCGQQRLPCNYTASALAGGHTAETRCATCTRAANERQQRRQERTFIRLLTERLARQRPPLSPSPSNQLSSFLPLAPPTASTIYNSDTGTSWKTQEIGANNGKQTQAGGEQGRSRSASRYRHGGRGTRAVTVTLFMPNLVGYSRV